VRYRWNAPDHGYQRWKALMDRPETLDFSPLGGEASDEAPWYQEPRGPSVVRGIDAAHSGRVDRSGPHIRDTRRRPRLMMKPRTAIRLRSDAVGARGGNTCMRCAGVAAGR